jgi:UDP-N-acetylmuramoyl-tripeptide--D-alanyl-D-alanine ligase
MLTCERVVTLGVGFGYTSEVRFHTSELATLLGTDLVGPDVEIDGASIDSREITAGALFVPVVAERNGHDFIDDALRRGAAAYLTSELPRGGSAIVVPDTIDALLGLGRAARERLRPPVIGVTGSVGKTSTKDLIAAACSAAVPTHANPASFNNELGLPLTLLTAPADTSVTVLEMGARGLGHISRLCDIGQPTIGVVTRVALAHGEQFGSIDQVARAKGELVEFLPADGVAVLNAGDPRVAAMANRTSSQVITYGRDLGDFAAVEIELDELLRPTFRLRTPYGVFDVRLDARGEHMAENAAAAVAAASAAGIDPEVAIAGLTDAKLSSGRMQVERTAGGAVVINDAYNANPTSVLAGVRALGQLHADQQIAVLGVMAELGDDSDELHRNVAAEIDSAGIRLIAVAAPAYGPTAEHVADIPTALTLLGKPANGTAILVKGSLVAGLQPLAAELVNA